MADDQWLDTYGFFEQPWESYEELYDSFEHNIPEKFNIAEYACDRWAEDKGRVALFAETNDGRESTTTFWQLQNAANRVANYLRDVGVETGDRVAITGTQKPEMLASIIATLKVGGVAVPVSVMYGLDGVAYRLEDAAAKVMIADEGNVDIFREARSELTGDIQGIVVDAEANDNEREFWAAISEYSRSFETVETDAEDSAVIIYTSGTTGDPKGVVHSHRSLLGQLPGFVFKHMDMEVGEDDVLWVLAEWSWIGLLGFILPALFYGRPVLGYARKEFQPEKAFELIDKYGVSFASVSPTAIRMMMHEDVDQNYNMSSIRVLSIGGEKAGEGVMDWVDETFGDPVKNVGWGQSECILPLGECENLGKSKSGSMGVPVPGQEVTIVDPETFEPTVPVGVEGELAIRYADNPICFKRYLNKPERTEAKVQNGWLLSEDLAHVDEDGFFFFHARKDDVIISSGYRMGPGEIEESLETHEAVKEVGVIGVPHETRGEIPKAFIELAEGYEGAGDDLKAELQDHVKRILAKYQYPREIEFIDEIPKTTSQKTQRVELRKLDGVE